MSKPIKAATAKVPPGANGWSGWFVFNVIRKESRKRDWVALLVDVHPDDVKNCPCNYRWLEIPGKHTTEDSAWTAVEDAIATRH